MAIFGTQLKAGFSYQVDFVSRYIWRGFDLNPNKKPALQPSITYAFGKSGLSFTLFTSFSFEDKNTNEIDFFLDYEFKTSADFSLSAGFFNYGWYFRDNFKFKDDTSQEIYVSAGLPNLFLCPRFTAYYDFGNGDGFYFQLETGHSLKLSENVNLDLSASLGYNAGQWLAEGVDRGFSDLNLGAAFPFKVKRFEITPFATYTFVLLDAIGSENHFWFGISLKYE